MSYIFNINRIILELLLLQKLIFIVSIVSDILLL